MMMYQDSLHRRYIFLVKEKKHFYENVLALTEPTIV